VRPRARYIQFQIVDGTVTDLSFRGGW